MRRLMPRVVSALAAVSLAILSSQAVMAVDNAPPVQAPKVHDKPPTSAEMRKAIELSLPYIQKGSDAWIHSKDCVSCHVVAFSIWSNQAARRVGISVDQKKIDEWVDFAHGESPNPHPALRITDKNLTELKTDGLPEAELAKLKPIQGKKFKTEQMLTVKLAALLAADELKQDQAQIMKRVSKVGPVIEPDTYAEFLLGGVPDKNVDKDWAKALTKAIVAEQKESGLWPAGGQLPSLKRPGPESDEATTMWIVLALASDPEAREASADALKRAVAALKKTKPGVTNESLILHLMIAKQFGEPSEVQSLLKELRGQQHPDGGWSWLRADGPSDAFDTGQTLFALRQIGVPSDDPAIQHAQEFLVTTQQKDGSWKVASQGPGTVVGWSLWGSMWAVIGLSHTLPE